MKRLTAILAAAVLILASTNARAGLIEVTATSTDPLVGDFSLIFDDVNGDGLLEWSEIVSFSGTTVVGNILTFLGNVPNLTGISILGTAPTWTFGPFDGYWGFCGDADCSDPGNAWVVPTSFYQYSQASLSVPEPGTLGLLALGLAGLGLARRRRSEA